MSVKLRHLSFFIAAVFLVSHAQVLAATITFEVLATFDYPGANAYTTADGINERGDVAGTYYDQGSVYRGFVRFGNGRFSDPINEPNTFSFTFASGINSSRTVCGSFFRAFEGYQGYILSGGTFTEFALSASSTFIIDINDGGNFCGNTLNPDEGFVSIGGTVTILSLGGQVQTSVGGINNFDQVVGHYVEGTSRFGFRRDADGTLQYPIAVASALKTQLEGINDNGQMVGSVSNDGISWSAVFFLSPGQHVLYNYPGAANTYFDGINNRGLICGSYYKGTGTGVGRHGFIVRMKPVL